ncbi:MAG: hypothetical protein V1672_01690 [Candidatus Diapherotrites archaeon]
MTKKLAKQKLEMNIPKEVVKRLQIINKIDDEELGFAVRNCLIKWWELKEWQKSK